MLRSSFISKILFVCVSASTITLFGCDECSASKENETDVNLDANVQKSKKQQDGKPGSDGKSSFWGRGEDGGNGGDAEV